ncbi:hypothetical protein [Paenibacillus guangzhouensis]|uniref:hypothetical protein n=1 Tax=Paenibacillus guangzhouensis TaxID=1473112 RepID=UPI0012674C5C|nr:hypothetical protein [Paenibacillus guangzhouensis]
MEIRINSVTLCHISGALLRDVYDVLTRYAMQFHVDHDHQRLYIVSPVQGIRIYWEVNDGLIPLSVTERVNASLTQLGFDVRVIADEEEKRRQQRLWDSSKPGLWLSVGRDKQYASGMTIYFSLNKMKASKQFASLLNQNIAKMTDIPVNGAFFEWKNTMNTLIPLAGSEPSIPTVQLACNDFAKMSERQIEDFTYCITRSFTAFYHQSFLIDVIQYFMYFQKAAASIEPEPVEEIRQVLAVNEAHEEEVQEQVQEQVQVQVQVPEQHEEVQPVKQPIVDVQSTVEQVAVQQEEQHEEALYQEAEEEAVQPHHIPIEQPEEPITHAATPSTNHSTFSWMQSQMVRRETKKPESGLTTDSFMGQMNRLAQASQKQKHEQKPINLLTINRQK